jgi:hypothetical protein
MQKEKNSNVTAQKLAPVQTAGFEYRSLQGPDSKFGTYSISAVMLPPTSFNVTVSAPASFT